MTPDERRRLLDAFTRDDEDIDALADVLYLNKVRVYEDTLGELADQYDFDVDDLTLSDEVLTALRDEADLRAEQMTMTYNGDLAGFIDAIPDDIAYEHAVEATELWATDRDEARAELVGITESYSAHADATVAFFVNNGIEVEFDFGGHGDDHPACVVCEALVAANPHPAERVVEVGTPHIQCRQRWHANVTAEDLPDELVLGQGPPAGILGNESLVQRAGGHPAAAAEVVNDG